MLNMKCELSIMKCDVIQKAIVLIINNNYEVVSIIIH